MQLPLNQILVGDVVEKLKELPDESVHMICTSPPYWGLRSYGVDGQIGLEKTLDEYVNKIVEVFREVRRILRPEGTVWCNLGDCYASGGGTGHQGKHGQRAGRTHTQRALKRGVHRSEDALKPKDLIGVPWRVALALQKDGWWLRSDIIWQKPNAMPSSVADRPTSSHEYVFLLSKRERYFYDGFAIREPLAVPDWENGTRVFGGTNKNGANIKHARTTGRLAGSKIGPLEGSHGTIGHDGAGMRMLEKWNNPAGRNKRSVWTIPTEPFDESHFAVFPTKLIEPMILAGTSEKGVCPNCGAPWKRITKSTRTFESGSGKIGKIPGGKNGGRLQGGGEVPDIRMGPTSTSISVGWEPTCHCGREETVPAIVCDIFMGAGTTALVALKSHRNFIGIELNPEYVAIAERRIAQELAQTRLF